MPGGLAVVHEDKLSAVLSEFARTLITDFPIQGILDHLVERIVEVLPVTSAGVTLISPGMAPRYIAASDESALRFERLQTDIGAGPVPGGVRVGGGRLGRRPADRRPVPALRPRRAGGRAGRRVHLPAAPRRRPARRARPLPRHARRARPARHGRGADAGRRRRRLPAQRAGPRRGPRGLGPLPPQRPARPADRAAQPAAAAGAARARRPARASARTPTPRSCSPTSTGSSRSTTPTAIRSATSCWSPSPDRLSGLVRPGDTLARFSGDEFVFLCEDLHSTADAEILARRIDEAFAEPVRARRRDRAPDLASVGIAFAGPGEAISNELVVQADIAMYQAKRKGGAGHQIIDLREAVQTHNRDSLEMDLRAAIAKDELERRLPTHRAQRRRTRHRCRGPGALDASRPRHGAGDLARRGRGAERADQ